MFPENRIRSSHRPRTGRTNSYGIESARFYVFLPLLLQCLPGYRQEVELRGYVSEAIFGSSLQSRLVREVPIRLADQTNESGDLAIIADSAASTRRLRQITVANSSTSRASRVPTGS